MTSNILCKSRNFKGKSKFYPCRSSRQPFSWRSIERITKSRKRTLKQFGMKSNDSATPRNSRKCQKNWQNKLREPSVFTNVNTPPIGCNFYRFAWHDTWQYRRPLSNHQVLRRESDKPQCRY